jgi:GNAT superfamily N-acetyltransferase
MKLSTLLSFVVLVITQCSAQQGPDAYIIKLLNQQEMQEIIPFCSETWRTMFSDYPYLYVGEPEEADGYFKWLCSSQDSAIVAAYLHGEPVGFISGTSFIAFSEHMKGSVALFAKNGHNPQEYFYFAEMIVLPEHRKNRLSYKLYKLLEEYAHELGYTRGCLVCENHESHPLKPKDYMELDWTKGGYTPTELSILFPWKTRQTDGTVKMEDHKLAYWITNFKNQERSQD